MNKEYTEKELKDLIDFTLENTNYKTNTILKHWKNKKSRVLSSEEKRSLKDYKLCELPLPNGSKFLSVVNMSGVNDSVIATIMQKYGGVEDYRKFYDDGSSTYWLKHVLIEPSKMELNDFEPYDGDKYMKMYKSGPIIMLFNPDHSWKEEYEIENDYKYSFENLIPKFRRDGYQTYYDYGGLSTFFRLVVKVDELEYTPAIEFLEKLIRNKK